MLEKSLDRDESLAGRTVDMTITATGRIAEAYDLYIDIYACQKHKPGTNYVSQHHQIFVRLIFWETTHKQILIGSVTVLEDNGMPRDLVHEIERISVPIEKKDYWKKMFEKALVVGMAQILEGETGLDWLNELWRLNHCSPKGLSETPNPAMDEVTVHTLPIASYESIKRNMRINKDGSVEVLHPESCCPADEVGLDHKCYDGPHGFVRSDNADGFELKPTTMPVSMIVK